MAGQHQGHYDCRAATPSLDHAGPWLFPFDRARHEAARRTLGPDTAGVFTRPTVTADVIDFHTREYERVCADDAARRDTATGPGVVAALNRLADVEDRHLVLLGTEHGHDTLPLAELAVVHRRHLAARQPAAHQPLLGLALVQLTHQLLAAGRFGDAVATGQEAIDGLTRYDLGTDVRLALVLALDVSVTTCLLNDRQRDAVLELRRATALLSNLASDDDSCRADLEVHRRLLGVASAWSNRSTADRDSHDGLRQHDGSAALRTTRRSAADDRYDDAVHLCVSDGDAPAAAAEAGAAVSAYRRELSGSSADQWHGALRRLSRALWRQSIIVSELLERPRDAVGSGREALSMIRRVLRVVEHPAEFDDLVGEFGVQLYSLAHTTGEAGLVGAHDQLAEEARRLQRTAVGEGAMRALGAALHQRAAEACETAVAVSLRGRRATATVRAGVVNSGHAVTIRRSLVTDDPITLWELANAQLAHGHLRCLDGQGQRGAQSMADAYRSVRTMPGPAGQTMRDAAEAALIAACSADPGIRPRSDWPL